MTLDLAAVVLVVLSCSCVVLGAVWLWWRLRTVERGLRLTSWDLRALAGALRKCEENEAVKRPHH